MTWHFDNDSAFDTSTLVPHFFEQRYDLDNVWAIVTARYTAGPRWETSFGVTPQRTAIADDYDTFFDPDGTVWVAGTTGGAAVHSFRVAQTLRIGRAGPARFDAGFRVRFDFADFQLGHKTVTRNGVLTLATDTTAPETTRSQLRELFVRTALDRSLGPRWTIAVEGEASPLSVGELLIRLPEKYPGQDIVFSGRCVTAEGRAALSRRGTRWPIEIVVDVGKTWSYRRTASLTRDSLGARVSIGHAWGP